MAMDRHGLGLAVTRICLGVFFIFEGLGKYQWFASASILAGRLQAWHTNGAPGSASRWYLEHIAMPGVAVFARLVPLGELISGTALLLGVWTPVFAFIAFFMALNFQIAGDAVFR